MIEALANFGIFQAGNQDVIAGIYILFRSSATTISSYVVSIIGISACSIALIRFKSTRYWMLVLRDFPIIWWASVLTILVPSVFLVSIPVVPVIICIVSLTIPISLELVKVREDVQRKIDKHAKSLGLSNETQREMQLRSMISNSIELLKPYLAILWAVLLAGEILSSNLSLGFLAGQAYDSQRLTQLLIVGALYFILSLLSIHTINRISNRFLG